MISGDFPGDCSPRVFSPGETILEAPARDGLVAYVETGLAKGRARPRRNIPIRETVNVVGERGWLGFEQYEAGPHFIDYVAVNETQAWILPAHWALHESPDVVRSSLVHCITNQWSVRASVTANKELTLEWKLLIWLVSIREATSDMEINFKQSDLADLIGVNRSVLNDQLQHLQERGLIELHRGFFILPSTDVMRKAFFDNHLKY